MQPAAPAPAADPGDGNLTVTAAGNIPSYSNHLPNPSANGPSVPDLSSLPADAGATNPTSALVYNSDTVNVLPVIQVAFVTAGTTQAHPTSSIVATLTWNGTAQTPVTFTIQSPAYLETVVMDLQVASPVTATGLFSWDVKLQAYDVNSTLQDTVDPRALPVVVNSSTTVGYGSQLGIKPDRAGGRRQHWHDFFIYGTTGTATTPKGSGPDSEPCGRLRSFVAEWLALHLQRPRWNNLELQQLRPTPRRTFDHR